MQAISSNLSVRFSELVGIWKEYMVEDAPMIVSKQIKSMTQQYQISYNQHIT